MKTEINHPIASKINWTATLNIVFSSAISLLVVYGYLPKEAAVHVVAGGTAVLNALIILFRTKFTHPDPEMGP